MTAESLEGHSDKVWGVCWSPTSLALCSCSGDRSIRYWRASSKSRFECKAVLDSAHSRTIRAVAFNPDGKLLASCSFDASTAVWEVSSGASFLMADWECIATLEGHENEVKACSWNAQGNLLATCSRDKSVWIWYPVFNPREGIIIC